MTDDQHLKTDVTLKMPGGRLAEQYEFLQLIDSGGMGTVYKARNVAMNQVVAIKMIQAGSLDDRHVQRFKQEATALSSIDHFNIVQLKDFGFTENSQPYMVLEYIDGFPLPQYLRQASATLETLRSLFMQVSDALTNAHERGVLHRDLKPSNIMVKTNADGTPLVKIIDFGIAKLLTAESNSAMTQTGEVLGSPAYMSPEQIAGPSQDARSDIYSFGCVMFEALTGVPPFQATSPMEMIFQQLNAEPPSLQSKTQQKIPQSLEAIVSKCLKKNPLERFQSMADLSLALVTAQFVDPQKDNRPALKKILVYASIIMLLIIAANTILLLAQRNEELERQQIEKEQKAADTFLDIQDTKNFASANDFIQKHISEHRGDETMKVMDTCDDGALAAFTQGNFATKNLCLSNTDIKGPGLAYLIRIPLHKLELQRASLTDRGLLEISKMESLRLLNIDATRVTAKGLAYLSNLTNLAKLSARDIDTDDEGLENICKIKSLAALSFEGNPRITDAGYSHLRQLKNLTDLSLKEIKITPGLIKILCQLKSLRVLYLNATDVTDADLKALSQSPTLKEIHLQSDEKITSAGLKYIFAMPQIASVDLRGMKWLRDSDLQVLCTADHPFYVSVDATAVTDAGMKTIAHSLSDHVDISNTRVTDAGLFYLAKAPNLKAIRFSLGLQITEGGIKRFEKVRPDVKIDKELTTTKILQD